MSNETPAFKILNVAPRFDDATNYSFEWNQAFLDKVADLGVDGKITMLLEDDAIKSKFREFIGEHDTLLFFDHGIDNRLVGQGGVTIVSTADAQYLDGKQVFAMACLSAKGLGPKAINEGAIEYWGAVESIGFTLEDAWLFGEVFIDGAYSRFIEKMSIDDVLQNMKDHFDLQKTKTDNPWTKVWLQKDKDMWIVLQEGDVPPPEKSWLEKLWKWICDLIESIF